jgi:hypothetical protein
VQDVMAATGCALAVAPNVRTMDLDGP